MQTLPGANTSEKLCIYVVSKLEYLTLRKGYRYYTKPRTGNLQQQFSAGLKGSPGGNYIIYKQEMFTGIGLSIVYFKSAADDLGAHFAVLFRLGFGVGSTE